jgi:hypothetical protein
MGNGGQLWGPHPQCEMEHRPPDGGAGFGAHQRGEKSAEAKERAAKRNFNKHVLWCRLKLDPEQELPRMREVLERLVATAKAAMLDNIEEDQEWERNTRRVYCAC